MKKLPLIYFSFFIALFVLLSVLRGLAALPEGQIDGVLILFCSLFATLIIYLDFKGKGIAKEIALSFAVLVIVNVIVYVFLYPIFTAPLLAYLFPLFVMEGVMIYWFLDKRIKDRAKEAVK